MKGLPGGADPFSALGLPAQADLTDDDVRSAWRRIATATHPDRADGGDPGRFAVAAAAYTMLRTRSGRGEALADLASRSPRARPARGASFRPRLAQDRPGRPAAPATGPAEPGPDPVTGISWSRLVSRIRRGRPARLALRLLIAAAVSVIAVTVAGDQPAAPALVTGALTWLLLTARHDLAPP